MKITAYVQNALSPVECASGDGPVWDGVITDGDLTWHSGCVIGAINDAGGADVGDGVTIGRPTFRIIMEEET